MKRMLGVFVAVAAGCSTAPSTEGEPTRTTSPAIVEIALPDRVSESAAPLRRPVVEFDHALHTDKLAQDGCEACHPKKAAGTPASQQPLEFELGRSQGTTDRDALMTYYHELCIGCHRDRAAQGNVAGAVACGECHAQRGRALSQRAPMAFDYTLHHLHSQADKEECEHCHHVERDPGTGMLVHEAGAEESCRGCHGATEQEGRAPLRAAAHQDCVNCHLERLAHSAQSGPVECVGCHDAATRQAALARHEDLPGDPPKPDVNQPKMAWVQAPGGTSNLVAFDHELHQSQAQSCSGCHHQRLEACSECHTLTGSADGGGVTLEDAFHRRTATFSCVGCHQQKALVKDCAGCHHELSQVPSDRACARCHSGPPAGSNQPAKQPTPFDEELAALPDVGDDFPETVVIDSLAADYTPVTLPHRQIVAALDLIARSSRLAKRFHDRTDALCAGCHHESPLGTRPPPCRSCHQTAAHRTEDMPGLRGAYHRQCMGCHLQMAIEPLGCSEGCHQEATKEQKP